MGTLAFKKAYASIGLEIRPQSAFTAFRALLPSADYSAEWSSQVWQPAADNTVIAVMRAFFNIWSVPNSQYSYQRPFTLYQANSNLLKSAKQPLLPTAGCHTRLDGQHFPLRTYHGVFFKSRKTLWGHNTAFIFHEYERVSPSPFLGGFSGGQEICVRSAPA